MDFLGCLYSSCFVEMVFLWSPGWLGDSEPSSWPLSAGVRGVHHTPSLGLLFFDTGSRLQNLLLNPISTKLEGRVIDGDSRRTLTAENDKHWIDTPSL